MPLEQQRVKASTQPDLSTRSEMSTRSLWPTACLCIWIACMWPSVLRWRPAGLLVCFKLKDFCDRVQVPLRSFQGRHGYLADQARKAANKPEPFFHSQPTWWRRQRGVPRRTLLNHCPSFMWLHMLAVVLRMQGVGAHLWGDGGEPEFSPMPFTILAAPVGSSVKCSSPEHGLLTQIPGPLIQTLSPFIPAPAPPFPTSSGKAT